MTGPRAQQDLEREFKRRGPWVTRFVIEGKGYGGEYEAAADNRLELFRKEFPQARRIIELGSLEGGHSFPLARMPGVEEVVAIEGRRANMERSAFVQKLLGDTKVRFIHANLEDFDVRDLGDFDAAYCVGLLYHLPAPWELLEEVAAVAPGILLWTHYAEPHRAKSERNGYKGWCYREWGFATEPLSGLSLSSFWPTREELLRMIADAGFPNQTILEEQPFHPHGPALTLVARRQEKKH